MAHILRRVSTRALSSVCSTSKRAFTSTSTDNKESTASDDSQTPPPNPPPPTFDYQAPKDDDSYRNYQSTRDFVRRYFILFPLAAACLYDWLFVRKNDFSQNREYKLVNRPFESLVIGAPLTRKILSEYKKYIYKQDTEEIKIVKNTLKKLIDANNLQKHFVGTKEDELPI